MIDILREEIKTVDSEKIESEERYKLKLLASFVFWNLQTTKNPSHGTEILVFERITPVPLAVFD